MSKETKIEKSFPSLKGKASVMKLEGDSGIKIADLVVCCLDKLEKNCLDKQRVREAMQKANAALMKVPEDSPELLLPNWRVVFLEELGLED